MKIPPPPPPPPAVNIHIFAWRPTGTWDGDVPPSLPPACCEHTYFCMETYWNMGRRRTPIPTTCMLRTYIFLHGDLLEHGKETYPHPYHLHAANIHIFAWRPTGTWDGDVPPSLPPACCEHTYIFLHGNTAST